MKSVTLSYPVKNYFNWIFQYKLHHIPFWVAFYYRWWTLRIGDISLVLSKLFLPYGYIKFAGYMVIQMFGVYFNWYFLIPKFLGSEKYVTYLSMLALTIFTCAYLVACSHFAGPLLSGKTFEEINRDHGLFLLIQGEALPSTVATIAYSMSIYLALNWMRTKRRQRELEKEKLETELKFLKSQINPHFLFNTINSIFVLIGKNPAIASESLAKFSDMLRYQLYECNEQQVPLRQELTYLKNFVDLQRLRQDCNHISLQTRITNTDRDDLTIAPLILIPFIENAFKHVSKGTDDRNWIHLHVDCTMNRLSFTISNSVSPTNRASTEAISYGGIGLQNVKRRLDLVYPYNHLLEIKQDEHKFTVIIQVTLLESVLPIHLKIPA